MGVGGYRESEFAERPSFQAAGKSKEGEQDPEEMPERAADRPGVSFLSPPGKLSAGAAAPAVFSRQEETPVPPWDLPM